MKIKKNGMVVYNSIDNTGATDEASLGARYAKGRIDSTWNNLTQNYYRKDQVVTLIEQALNDANLLKAMIVTEVPAVADASPNIIYLVPVAGQANVYTQHKKVLTSQNPDAYTMATLGSTEVEMSDIQVTALPPATAAVGNRVLQYTGTSNLQNLGKFYWCAPKNYYAWETGTTPITTCYVENLNPAVGDNVYTGTTNASGEFIATNKSQIATLQTETDYLTDTDGLGLYRTAEKDVVGYSWVLINNFENLTIVNSLPTTGEADVRYLVKVTDTSNAGYHLDEYVYLQSKWICISKEKPAPFIATINETSHEQLKAAIDSGSPVYVYSDITGILRPAIMASAGIYTASVQYMSLAGSSSNYTVDLTSCSITGTTWTATQIGIALKSDLSKYVPKLTTAIAASTTNYIRAFAMNTDGLITSTNGAYTKSDTISASSTTAQIPSAKAVRDYVATPKKVTLTYNTSYIQQNYSTCYKIAEKIYMCNIAFRTKPSDVPSGTWLIRFPENIVSSGIEAYCVLHCTDRVNVPATLLLQMGGSASFNQYFVKTNSIPGNKYYFGNAIIIKTA